MTSFPEVAIQTDCMGLHQHYKKARDASFVVQAHKQTDSRTGISITLVLCNIPCDHAVVATAGCSSFGEPQQLCGAYVKASLHPPLQLQVNPVVHANSLHRQTGHSNGTQCSLGRSTHSCMVV